MQPCSLPRQSRFCPRRQVSILCWNSIDNFSFQTAGWQPVEESSSRHDQPHGLDCQVTFCNTHLIIQYSSQNSGMRRGISGNLAKDIFLCIYLSMQYLYKYETKWHLKPTASLYLHVKLPIINTGILLDIFLLPHVIYTKRLYLT